MLAHSVTETTRQRPFEQLKPLAGSPCLAKAFSQPTGRRSPKCFQIDVSIGEIARRESEKRKSAARFEVNTDDKGFFCSIGRDTAPMRA